MVELQEGSVKQGLSWTGAQFHMADLNGGLVALRFN